MKRLFILSAILSSCMKGYANFFGRSTSISHEKTDHFNEDMYFNSGSYGVDVSYPIHKLLTQGSDRSKYYNQIIEGCYRMFSKSECDYTETYRMRLCREQPATQHNYTESGFKKMKLPSHIYDPLLAFFKKHRSKATIESWGIKGYPYINHWESPSYMINLEDPDLEGGPGLRQYIWDNVKPIIEEWVGRKVVPTSLYGIRVYSNGAVLAPHVDRLPLISSCIINVDQDVDEPWPVEIYSHFGKAYNVSMEPGDLVLYESHTVVHGRPHRMKDRHYANVFVHYEPVDHAKNNKFDRQPRKHLDKAGLDALHAKVGAVGGHEALNHDEKDEDYDAAKEGHENGQTLAHMAARLGELDTLVEILRADPDQMYVKDVNGWQILHEAAHAGRLNCLKYLVELGADVGVSTKHGGTALWWAKRNLPPDHQAIEFLESVGAPDETDAFLSEF